MPVAELRRPTMFARIGVMRALKRHVERRVRSIAQGHPLGPPEWRATDDEGMAAIASIGFPLNGFHVSAGR
jgi:hypothetical protein